MTTARVVGLLGNKRSENGILRENWLYMNKEVAYREILSCANEDKTFFLLHRAF